MKTRYVALMAFWLAAGPAAAAVDIPAQGYQEAYRLIREAKRADFLGNADLAAWKWHEARELLQRIVREYPAWNRTAVQGQLNEVSRVMCKAPPPPAQSYAMLVEETRGFAGNIAEFGGRKVSLLKQVEWERQRLSEIERLSAELARKENARRVLGLAQGARLSPADIRRAEAREPTPTPVKEKKVEEEEEAAADQSKVDTDNDGLPDVEEEKYGTDPRKPDTDRDKLLDGEEVHEYKTDPLNKDTDGDDWDDGIEIERGFDPLDPNDPGYPPD